MREVQAGYRLDHASLPGARRVFAATRLEDGQRVIVKTLDAQYPSAEELATLRHEFSLLGRLAEAGAPVARPIELLRHGSGLALALTCAPGRSLDAIRADGPIDVARFCDVAISVTQCLETIHGLGIVHKDIKPHHFFVDFFGEQESMTTTLIDFGLAMELARERAAPAPLDRLEGTLAYIAPEQTGRMNRSVDRRSDLYSLGVTFYEFVTGRLPFESEDVLELVHAHVARVPVAPAVHRPELPAVLSDIVMRLLEKAPDDRYQTAAGVRADLERVRARLRGPDSPESFELGQDDHDGELRIPEKLYGREEQCRALVSTFRRVQQGATELLLVSGSAGIGKSVLVFEIHRELARGGHFVSGKFDQYDRGVPYSALAAACGELVRVHLAASTGTLEAWKRRVVEALGENARVVADIVPELELAIGLQPPVAPLPPAEAHSRFERSFQQFVRASATRECPLVLFLDDLQWADSASLSVLLQVLWSSEQEYLLVIGNYRDEEVDAVHPLSKCLEALEGRLPIHRIEVGPLSSADVECLVSDALPHRNQPIEPLARLIHEKTSGNPFFVAQFLQRLEAEGGLSFDRERGFHWDLEAIAGWLATDNVVDLVINRLAQLEPRARELLPLAACIGHTFRLSTLMVIAEKEPPDVVAGLQAAVIGGFVVPLDRNHRILADLLAAPGATIEASYRFAHDRVQQAAHATIPEGQRARVHLRIGRLLLDACGPTGPADDQLFDIIGHLNRGRQHLASGERLPLARLDLRAAERAKTAAAHEAALEFSTVCLELLGATPWQADHETCLAAHLVAVESHYVAGRAEAAFVLIQTIEENARGALERIPARNLKSDLLTHHGRLEEAIQVSLESMSLLGEVMPDPRDPAALGAAIGAAFGGYQQALGGRDVASLSDLALMTDPAKLALIDTIARAIPSAFQSNPHLNVLLVLRAVQICLDHGTAPSTPFFYTVYGIVHNVVTNDYARALQFGKVGLELGRRPEYVGARCRVHFIFATHLSPWVRPLRESFDHHEKAIAAGVDTGDHIHAGYCMGFGIAYRLYAGEALPDVARRIPGYRETLKANGDVINLSYLSSMERLIASLTGQTSRLGCLDGDGFSEAEFEQQASPTMAIFYSVKKAMARYLSGDAESALRATEECQPLPGLYYNAEYVFYHGMASAELAVEAEGERREQLLAKLDEDVAKFALWAGSCAENFGAPFELLRAESLALRGDEGGALSAYERSIERATAVLALHHLALAFERAGRFHQRRGRRRLANGYLIDACYHYDRWGATRKAEQLREEFPDVARLAAAGADRDTRRGASATRTAVETTSAGAGWLDLTSAMRATQAIASELRLEPLVRRLMEILVENAGATRGCLVLQRNDMLEVSASLTLEPQRVEVGLHEPLEQSTRLPAAIVQYCARSREVVVLDDAGADRRFAKDLRSRALEGRSVACLPLLHQGRLVAVLYLENDTGSGVFHAGRVERLQFLGGHAAVALQNARLYDELEEANEGLERRVQLRTAELSGRNADMRRVLDNVSQGLLTVDLQKRLASERSSVVDEWFGSFEVGCSIKDYLARLDPKFAEMFDLMFDMLVEGDLPEEMSLHQMPRAMSHAGRQFRFDYEAIRVDEKLSGLLIIVDDVTEALKRAREEAEQKEELAICRRVSRDRANLVGFFEEGRELVNRICREGASLDEVRGPLHTLKGNAAMLGFELLASLCHHLEDIIDAGAFSPDAVSTVAERWRALESTLDLLLGRDGRNRIDVACSEVDALVRRLEAGAGAGEALESLLRWRLEPLARPLGHLGELALGLCRRLNRGQLALRIEDGGLSGEAEKGSKLWSALVHIVRNAVDHGLETAEERSALGKPQPATLELRARRETESVLIEIVDDGRGVAWERVRQRAQERGLPSASRADLVEALFAPELSTRDQVTAISGRGMGLSAVREEVESLGGSITMASETGRGCSWVVRVPAAALGVRAMGAPSSDVRSTLSVAAAQRHMA
jgi:predicted ATPase/serine/threonine protein kinase/GAF domain-containing protein/HPt (histidine-containing phosphotransfer) domain-containing protein